MDEPERITLTQRRKEMTGASKLNRSKLERISDDMDDEQSGSAKSIVAWMVIIIAVSVAAYFGVTNYLDGKDAVDDDTQAVDVTPVPTAEDLLIASNIQADTLAINMQDEELYTLEDQSVGEDSEDTFTVEKVWVQPYTTFIRYEIEIAKTVEVEVDVEEVVEIEEVDSPEATGEDGIMYPMAEVIYDADVATITLNLSNISADNSEFEYDETISLTDSVIDNVLHAIVEGENESYVISLVEKMPFVLHVIEDDESTKIVLDIMELSREEEEPVEEIVVTVEPEDETEEPEEEIVEVTQTADNTGSTETEFSMGAQSLVTGTTGNVSTISKYQFFDAPSFFTYRFFISGDYPNIEANLEDTELTITIKNLAVDRITGNGGTGFRDDFNGAKDIEELNVVNKNNVSTYVFTLSKSMEYRFWIDEVNSRIVLEIKH